MVTPTLAGLFRYVRRVVVPTRFRPARLGQAGVALVLLTVLATMPVAAQSPGTSFCSTQMAQTIKNLFTLIQFGGPLIGGVIALGATVLITMVRSAEKKKEYKQLRNQGIVYGVLVAPLGTTIVTFLLNNVVAGGASCGF